MKHLTIIGNIGFDAVIKEFNGNRFVEFTVAVNEKFKKQDGTTVESTDWINVSYPNLGIAQHLLKGNKVLVMGNMSVRTYQAKDKTWKASINLRAHNIQFLGGGQKQETGNTNQVDQPHDAQVAQGAGITAGEPVGDLPF